jgi:LAGLIDADG DNA endonuclease family protein/cytochrome c oxidase subunit II-like protein
MQFLVEYNFNLIYEFFNGFHINLINNFFFGGYDYDECCCGGSCSCYCNSRQIDYKLIGFILLMVLTLIIGYLKIWNKNNLKYKPKMSDVPLAWGLYFQDGASPSFEGIVDLHNRIMFYLVVILFGVSWIMLSIIWNFNKSRNKLVYRYLNHGTLIELIWTVGPALVLVAIAFPSFKLLYLMDEVIDPAMTVKVTGLFLKLFNYFIYLYKKFEFDGLKLYSLYLDKLDKDKRLFEKNYFYRFFHVVVKAKRRIGPHDKDVVSVIIGSLLGDSYGNKRYVEGTRFCFRQSIIHKNYLFWLYWFFNSRGYCSNLEPRLYTRSLKRTGVEKKYYGYEFNTYTFRSFDWIYKMFYKKGKKRIHPDVGEYLTPLALAIWISDDGCWTKSGVRIACNTFSLKEVELLIRILNKNFDLVSNIQSINSCGQYSIYIQKKSIPKLREIVSPFIHNSMLYKLGL